MKNKYYFLFFGILGPGRRAQIPAELKKLKKLKELKKVKKIN